MNWGLRKIIKTRGAFPTDEAVRKLLYIVLLNLSQRWTRSLADDWKAAINQFIILYEDRVPIPRYSQLHRIRDRHGMADAEHSR